jgi:hypothetical protein
VRALTPQIAGLKCLLHVTGQLNGRSEKGCKIVSIGGFVNE